MSPTFAPVLAAVDSTLGFPALAALIAVPLAAALVVALLPAGRGELVRMVAAVSSAITLGIAGAVVWQFDRNVGDYQFVSQRSWSSTLGLSWHVGVDGISLWLVALTAILFPIAIFGPRIKHDPKPYITWLLVLQAAVFGSFVALDLFLFFVFFELVLVPMYFLIAGWGYDERRKAALKFFLYTLTGSAFLFVAMLALVFLHQDSTGVLTFDLPTLAAWSSVSGNLASSTAMLLFVGFAIGFAVKVPLVPVHTWLPDAHTQAPTAGSVLLAGVLLKLGTYGLIRFGLELFPKPSLDAAPWLLSLAVIGVVYGAIVAAVQKDLKRLIAYSSVAHMGFIVMGTYAFNPQALSGAVLQMVNHGVSTGALFLMVGMLYDRRHTRLISELRGLWKVAPVFGGVFLLVAFSSIGLPGTNGFVGEFLTLVGTFQTRRWWAVIAVSGVVLAAVYLLWAFQRVFTGEPDEANANTPDLTWHERLTLAPLLVLIVFMGVFPTLFLERIEPSVNRVLEHVSVSTGEPIVDPGIGNESNDEGHSDTETEAESSAEPSSEGEE